MKKAYGYSIYGLIGGIGPSRGMDTLRDKAIALGVESPPTFQYVEWKQIVEQILAQPEPGALTFIWGHSFGANAATWIMRELAAQDARKVDYVAGFDPSRTTLAQRSAPLQNFRHATCFRGTGPSVPGHETWRVAEEEDGELEIIDVRQIHSEIDDNETLHEHVLKKIRKLMDVRTVRRGRPG